MYSTGKPDFDVGRSLVRAARVLNKDSSTGIIDMNLLYRTNTTSATQDDVNIFEENGHLKCFKSINPCYWLKNITLAQDCPSSNVLLYRIKDGVRLQVTSTIQPGEPLRMWFGECTRDLFEIPHLKTINMKDRERNGTYTCHICASNFLFPNALKLHLALGCHPLNRGHIWTLLANKIAKTPRADPNIDQDKVLNLSVAKTQRPNNRTASFQINSLLAFKPPAFDKMDPMEVEEHINNINPPDRKSFECMFCKGVYSSRYNLKIHVHKHTGFRLHCNICSHSASDPSNFNKHMMGRHGVRKSPHNCSKIFVTKNDLKRHMHAKHLGERNDEINTETKASRTQIDLFSSKIVSSNSVNVN